jgi:hypothetical protein
VVEGYTERRTRESSMRQVFGPTCAYSPRRLQTDHVSAVSTREYQSYHRREDYLDHDLRCLLRGRRNKEEKQLLVVDRLFHIRIYQASGIASHMGTVPGPQLDEAS